MKTLWRGANNRILRVKCIFCGLMYPLDTVLIDKVEPSDNRVYCRRCASEKFGVVNIVGDHLNVKG